MLQKVHAAGIDMQVQIKGEGSPLLMVHGFPLDHTMWQAQIDLLANHAMCIAPDLRGFGQSGTVEGVLTMERLADDLANLLDALRITDAVTFCGLSMGGYVGWQFLRRHPSRVRRLILCDTRAAADSPEVAAGRHKTAELVTTTGSRALVTTMIPKLFSEATRNQRPELVDQVRQTIQATNPQSAAAALRGMAERRDFQKDLPQVGMPTLVICGTEDTITPMSEMQAMAAAIPNSRFVEIPDAGHMAPLENPQPVYAAIKYFLETGGE